MEIYGSYWEQAQSYTIKCPVCQTNLGYRDNNLKTDKAHCKECRTTFLFTKDKDIPFKSILDTGLKKGCTCLHCQSRAHPTEE